MDRNQCHFTPVKQSQNLTQLAGLPQMGRQGELEGAFSEGVKGKHKCPHKQGTLLHFLLELPLLLAFTFPVLSF